MTDVPRLFEAKERQDSSPCHHGENILEFLDRVGPSSFWDDVRELLESWLHRHPDPRSLHRQFKKEFDAKFWELYVHEMFRRLGHQAQVEREGTRHPPDYTFTKGSEKLVVECWSSATAGFDRSLQLHNGALEFVQYNEEPIHKLAQELNDRITSPELSVCLDDVVHTGTYPSFRRLSVKVQAWIDGKPQPEQKEQFSDADWSFTLTAIPKYSNEPFVAIYPCVAVDPGRPTEALLNGIRKKAKKSYLQDEHELLVIAASFPSTFLSMEEVEAALYREGGLWHGGSNSHVAAVMIGKHIKPWSITWGLPTVWLRPVGTELQLPLETARMISGRLSWMEASTTPHSLFGLPEGWGEGDPFPPVV